MRASLLPALGSTVDPLVALCRRRHEQQCTVARLSTASDRIWERIKPENLCGMDAVRAELAALEGDPELAPVSDKLMEAIEILWATDEQIAATQAVTFEGLAFSSRKVLAVHFQMPFE